MPGKRRYAAHLRLLAHCLTVLLFAPLAGHAQPAPPLQLSQLLTEFKGHSFDENLRSQIITLVLAMPKPPPVPPEALAADGRGQYIFKTAKSQDDYLAAAKAYLEAIELAPWVAGYYYNLGAILEKTPLNEHALFAYRRYLLAAPRADDAEDVRRKIAGLQYAVQQTKAQLAQRTVGADTLHRDDLYRLGGASQQVAGRDIAVKLVVDPQTLRYQLMLTCFPATGAYFRITPLTDTNTSIGMCPDNIQTRVVINTSGDGPIQVGIGADTLRTTIQALFQARRVALGRSIILRKVDYAPIPARFQFFITSPQSGDAARWPMYEATCSGDLLNSDLRAPPIDVVVGTGLDFPKFGYSVVATGNFGGSVVQNPCDSIFTARTGYYLNLF